MISRTTHFASAAAVGPATLHEEESRRRGLLLSTQTIDDIEASWGVDAATDRVDVDAVPGGAGMDTAPAGSLPDSLPESTPVKRQAPDVEPAPLIRTLTGSCEITACG